ncbi:unnamed protein product, partial [Linum tenue]
IIACFFPFLWVRSRGREIDLGGGEEWSIAGPPQTVQKDTDLSRKRDGCVQRWTGHRRRLRQQGNRRPRTELGCMFRLMNEPLRD